MLRYSFDFPLHLDVLCVYFAIEQMRDLRRHTYLILCYFKKVIHSTVKYMMYLNRAKCCAMKYAMGSLISD